MSAAGNAAMRDGFRIHPATRPGHVALTVANLDRLVPFYQQAIGLQLQWRDGPRAGLGVGGPDLLRLVEVPAARRYRGTTGIYHFALLLPNRRELARVIARLFALGHRHYPTDHVMTKTTYLDDPEGNHMELYADTPEDGSFAIVDGMPVARHADGRPSDGREPLDVPALLRHLEPGDQLDQPMPPATTMGHVHLYVADLEGTMRFYHEGLGFDHMGLARAFRMGMVSAGGYHHHIGFNTWVGAGAPPPPPGAQGLRYFTMVVPDRAELIRLDQRLRLAGLDLEAKDGGLLLRDPAQNGLWLTDDPGVGPGD